MPVSAKGPEQSETSTRERLLDAASDEFRRSGYHGASVASVAGAASYTVGAVYSSFGGKQELLLALVERESRRVAADIAAAAEGGRNAPEKLRRGAAAWIAFLDEQPDLYAVFMEFWAVAARDPAIRARNAELWGTVRNALGELLERHAESAARRLALPAEQVGAAVMALADGLALQRLEAPGAIPEDLLGSLLDALVPALTRQA